MKYIYYYIWVIENYFTFFFMKKPIFWFFKNIIFKLFKVDNKRIKNIKQNWFASDAADKVISPNEPSIIVSVILTPTFIRLCSAIGILIAATVL